MHVISLICEHKALIMHLHPHKLLVNMCYLKCTLHLPLNIATFNETIQKFQGLLKTS